MTRGLAGRAGLPVERLGTRDERYFAEIDAIAYEAFPDGGFSASEELSRPWARLWIARPTASRWGLDRPADPAREIAAFLVAWHVADELHVLNVATARALQRRGIGTALLLEVLAYAAAEHVRLVLLEVRRSNRGAIRLYRALGFTAMGVRPGYYADNQEDAIEMVLSLDPVTGFVVPGRDEIRIDG